MKRQMTKMSSDGDTVIAEWDKTTSADNLAKIEQEFNSYLAAGWFAADITDKKDVLIRKFDPEADILLIPRMVGGAK